MLNLVSENDPILRQKSPIFNFNSFPDGLDFEKLSLLIDEMNGFMHQNKGIGLAAPQVNLSYRFFIMGFDEAFFCCINPEILERIDEEIDSEGCLSFPDLKLNIRRSKNIRVKFFDREGKEHSGWFEGLVARCFQHELDHLDGITFDTIAPKISLRMALDKRKKLLKRRGR